MYHRKTAYAVTKLAQILHIKELQRRIGNGHVKAISVCPSWVRTNILPPPPLGTFLRIFAFGPEAGILSTLGAMFSSRLQGGEFVTNSIPPLVTRSWYPALFRTLNMLQIRVIVVDLIAVVMAIVQAGSYGFHVVSSSEESSDQDLAKELFDWSEAELRKRKYIM
jgi:hypothetical protein